MTAPAQDPLTWPIPPCQHVDCRAQATAQVSYELATLSGRISFPYCDNHRDKILAEPSTWKQARIDHPWPIPETGLLVTITDLAAGGKSESQHVSDDYLIITAGSCYVHGIQWHANGTHVLTVKGRK